jgi:hypothetical protein
MFNTDGTKFFTQVKYNAYKSKTPIYPVSDTKAGGAAWDTKTHIVYDSFMKPRTKYSSFYPIKAGQMMYSIKGSLEDIYAWKDFISNVLDREDVSAREINEFAGSSINNLRTVFHSTCTSQINYIGNTTETAGTNRIFSANLVIKFEYHVTDIYNN